MITGKDMRVIHAQDFTPIGQATRNIQPEKRECPEQKT